MIKSIARILSLRVNSSLREIIPNRNLFYLLYIGHLFVGLLRNHRNIR